MKDSSPFYLSKRNKRGTLIFLCLALIIVFIPRIVLSIIPEEKFKISSKEISQLNESSSQRIAFSAPKYKKRKGFSSPPCKFDPNNYKLKDWQYLGLSPKQAAIVLKFSKRGIYSNEQLKKIFVISDELFELIKDSTFYSDKYSQKENFNEYKKEPKAKVLININSASQEDLETIPGVGTFYAKNILKQRDRLGGFHKIEQLLEVWKMDIEKYNEIEEFIQIKPQEIKLIELNKVTAEELKSHPYLNWSIANSIVKMRIQKGGYKTIEEIKESVLIDEELFEKIKPYLSL